MMLKKVLANMPVLRTFTTMIEAPVNPIDGSNRRQGILMHRNIFRKVTTAALTLTATFAFGLGTSSEAWGGQDIVGTTDRTSAWDKVVTTDRTSAWDKVITTDRTSAWDKVITTDRTSAWDKVITTDRTSAWDKVVTTDRTSAWD